MAEFKSVPIAKIHVPERLRAVDEDHALAIQASIVEQGLIQPVTLRATPRGARAFTLVAGAHRLRAVELNDEPEIEALVIKADADEAQLVEISENLFRNELSALDRAMSVMAYRETWERKYGKIDPRGGRPRNSVNLTELIQQEATAGFSTYVAERLGLSVSAVERAQRIAQNLITDVRHALQGRPEADNQSLLLSLAKLEPAKQKKLVEALKLTDGDFARARAAIEDAPATKPSRDQQLVSTLVSTWGRASAETRRSFVTDHLPEDDQRAVYETLKAKFEGASA